VSFLHKFTSFPLNSHVPPNEGIMIGFPIASQVLFIIMFTCVSSSRTQSMSKSPILASTCSFSSNISDNQASLCSFRVSCICINTFYDSFQGSAISVSVLGFP
jgi:hypothetical protein